MKSEIRRGIVLAIVALFPAAFVVTLVYRFPIPLGGYASGLSAAFLSLPAMLFYGLFGAFPVAAGLGALSGLIATRLSGSDLRMLWKLTCLLCFLSALVVAGTLSVLDKIIGPW